MLFRSRIGIERLRRIFRQSGKGPAERLAQDVPGVDGPAALFEFEDQPSIAYLEGWYAGQVVEDPQEVASVATALSMIKGCALSPRDSRQLIAEIRG